MINIYIPKTRGKDTRYGDSQIIYDLGYCVVIDGGCDTLATDTVAFLKTKGLKHLTLIVTHWHADHYEGARAVLDSAHTIVDEIICYNPSEVQPAISKSEYSEAKSFISRAQSLKKKITYIPSGKVTEKNVGSIKVKLYRVGKHSANNSETVANNTSIATYFPDLAYFTSGDTIGDTITALSAFNSPIVAFKIPHHGNACPQSVTAKFKALGAKFAWYNDTGNVNGDFLMYGAKRCKEAGLTIRNTSKDIDFVIDNQTMTVDGKGYSVPYKSDKWIKTAEGRWTYIKDGNLVKGKWLKLDAWYYFDEQGFALSGCVKEIAGKTYFFGTDCRMKTGWQNLDGKWYYLDASGAAKTGWVLYKNYWYYLDPETKTMLTGWVEYNGKRYYCEPNTANTEGHCYTDCTAQIDGISYKFDKNGVPMQLSEEGASGDPYKIVIPKSLTRMNGIDIASYQSALNIARLDDSTHFVIIKATQGTGYVNPCCNKHYAQAKAAGKLVGLYHYAGGKDAIAEAQYFVGNIKNYIGEALLALDWESANNKLYHKGGDVAWCKKFMDEVYRLTKVRCVLYISKSDTRNLNWAPVTKDYALWCAQYANYNATGYRTSPWTDNYGFGAFGSPAIYQYTSSLTLSGYSGRLDGDLAYMGVESWLKFAKGDRTK